MQVQRILNIDDAQRSLDETSFLLAPEFLPATQAERAAAELIRAAATHLNPAKAKAVMAALEQ
jgi:hypothetical protein